MLNRAVLVLNSSYEAIDVCSVRSAFRLLAKGKAVMEHVSSLTVHTSRQDFLVPNVIRTVLYHRVPRSSRAVSRKRLLLRDNLTCQYCGRKFPAGDLTLDHILPKSRGGKHLWENLATCCFPCNNRKANRTPEEAKMPLIGKPSIVNIHTKHKLLAKDEDSWKKYLYFS